MRCLLTVDLCPIEIAEAALRILLQASSALRPADLSAALVHCARLDLKKDISAFAQRLTKEGNPAVNPAVPALAAMLANNQDLAHACFEASGELLFAVMVPHAAYRCQICNVQDCYEAFKACTYKPASV